MRVIVEAFTFNIVFFISSLDCLIISQIDFSSEACTVQDADMASVPVQGTPSLSLRNRCRCVPDPGGDRGRAAPRDRRAGGF